MAFNVVFYPAFAKRPNSTKIPSGGVTWSCELKDQCSLLHPEILLHRLSSDETPKSYNYCYIEKFGRYYWVSDWTWQNGVWKAHLNVDVLSSWKTHIGSLSAYIERSGSTYNGDIVDTLYPTTTNTSHTEVSMASGYNGVAPSGGCYVLGIINNANFSVSQAGGAVTYYAMTVSQMRSLMHYLLSTGFLEDSGFPAEASAGQQLLQDTAKAFINPVQYITSCMWFPVSADAISDGNNVAIVLGYWDLDSNVAQGKKVTAFAYTDTISGTIPDHPQISRGAYLNYSPYTRISISVPPFGLIPIDTSFRRVGNFIYCRLYVDVITGKAQLRVTIQPDSTHLTSGVVVTEASAMFGIPIQISQLTPDYMSAMSSAVSSGAGIGLAIAESGIAGGAVQSLLSMSSVGNTINALMPQTAIQGVSGSFLQNIIPPTMTVQHFRVVSDDNTEFGKPLCQVRTINTLSGFIKCGEFTNTVPCMDEEKIEISRLVRGGFFWE